MKIIINTTTLSSTGVTQASVSFIYECIKFNKNTYHVFMSQSIANQINKSIFPENFFFYSFRSHPLYGINGYKTLRKLKEMEKNISPDIVFSVFGPSIWTPKAKHIQGFAVSFFLYPESVFFKRISIKEKIWLNFRKSLYRHFLKRNSKFFVCETEIMSQRLTKFLKIPIERVFTVGNTYNHYFDLPIKNKHLLPLKEKNEFRILSLCTFQSHKNLKIINDLIPYMDLYFSNINIKFVLTIDKDSFDLHFSENAKKFIINIGRIPIDECPNLYSEVDIAFIPTLIESFSANYPEAMKMKIPIVTSDLDFAHSICDNAALYFNPLDAKDAAEKLYTLSKDKKLYNTLINNGIRRLWDLETAESRALKYLDICHDISKID